MAITRASVGRHPLHSTVEAFPVALWGVSLGCAISYRFGGEKAICNELLVYEVGASQANEEPHSEAKRRAHAA